MQERSHSNAQSATGVSYNQTPLNVTRKHTEEITHSNALSVASASPERLVCWLTRGSTQGRSHSHVQGVVRVSQNQTTWKVIRELAKEKCFKKNERILMNWKETAKVSHNQMTWRKNGKLSWMRSWPCLNQKISLSMKNILKTLFWAYDGSLIPLMQ